MTISEMHVAVKLELDKSAVLELAAFEPDEIDFWLNTAIRAFVKQRYREFERIQKRIDDLKPLVETVAVFLAANASPDPPTGLSPGDELYLVNSYSSFSSWDTTVPNYWFTISERVYINPTGGTTHWTGVTECTLDEYPNKLEDPYSEHVLHYGTAKPLKISDKNDVQFVSDGNYSISVYSITYLRKPEEVNISGTNCDLPEHTHDEVVKIAVKMMLENIEQPRYNTYQNEVNSME